MATKKISELPLITTLSGSQVDGGSVLPVVVGGTTNQISVENFSRFATAYSATTSSNNFLGQQNITGNVNITGTETVTGTLNVVGGGSVSGDFSIGGKLTVQELHTEVTSASILFESGSTILGNTADDIHTVTGTILLNGQALGTGQLNAYTGSLLSQTTLLSTFTTSINLATASLNLQTGSQDLVNRRISSTTGSINTTTSSFDSVFLRISSTTGSINTTTSSFNSVFLGISSVTGAMNTQSSSQNSVNLAISTYTGSQNIINSSVDSHILKQSIQTGSQDLVNLTISTYTGSNEVWKDGVRGEVSSIEAWTASLDSLYATDAQLFQLYQATASIQAFTGSQIGKDFTLSVLTSSIDKHILNIATQTGSQDLVNLGISTVTGSLIGITNGLMAFTAALDSTYATDAQLYQLYAETASIKAEIAGIEALTASMKAAAIVSSSTQITNYHTFAQTSSINTFYSNQIVSGNLEVRDGVTGSFKGNLNGTATSATNLSIGNSSTNTNYALLFTTAGSNGFLSAYTDAFSGLYYNPSTNKLTVSGSIEVSGSVNVYGGTITGSILATNGVVSGSSQIEELSQIAGIEAYTASLKNAFSVNGNNDVYFTGKITAQELHTTYTTSSVLFQSGSSKFGNSSDDKHEFTGSVNVNGNFTHNATTASFAGVVGIGITPEFTLDVNGDIALNRNNKLQFTGGVVGDRARSYLTGDGNNNIFVYGPSSNLIATFGYTGDTTFSGPVSGTRFTPTYVTSTSGYENITNTVSTAGGVYYFVKDSGTGEGSSATTFNITGVPDTDGVGFDLTLVVKKSATVANINTTAIVQINGVTIGEIGTVFASGTAAVTTIKTARMVRVGGNWRPMGAVGTY